ncbi:MAG: polyhydroxyalkanoic acid system family protein [Pirellulales bacterium]
MPLISLSVKHGRSLEEARLRLEETVAQALDRFGSLLERVEWSADRDRVKLFGPGVELEMRVDAQEVYVTGDMPFLSKLLGRPLVAGLKGLLEQTFQKRLP